MKNVMFWAGAGQIGMAIARRMGAGMKIVAGDRKVENAQAIAKIMNEAGFDVVPMEMDLSSRESIRALIAEGQKYGPIKMLVNAAGVSPSQASVEAILKVDLYGTAVLLEEVGKVIASGGVGVTISSQSGWRMPALTAEQDLLLATTPRRSCFPSTFCSRKISGTRSTPTSWRSAATKSALWPWQWHGEGVARGSTILPPVLSSRRWRWTNSTARAVTFIRICSPGAPRAVPERQTRSPMWRNCL